MGACDVGLCVSVKDWFEHDERLLPVVDSYIGQKVKASEKRTNAVNAWIAVATTVAGAIVGWFASGILPPVHFLP